MDKEIKCPICGQYFDIEEQWNDARAERQEEILDLIKFFAEDWNCQSNKRVPYKAIYELIEFIRQNDTSERVAKMLKEQNNDR